jgi:hypothetical protein
MVVKAGLNMITFAITTNSSVSPAEICEGIFDVEKWTGFTGYGPLPGIRKVTKSSRQGAHVGTVFNVENTDGSKHTETVQAFDSGKRLVMKMDGFSSPLSRMTTHFIERWDFAGGDPNCHITRTFELYPKSTFATIPLWLISRLLKKAVERHTRQITNPERVR